MDKNLMFIIAILELLVKYGLPAVIQIIQTWGIKGEPTLEDIERLKSMVSPFDSYFPTK